LIDDATKTVVALRVANIEIYCFMENSQQQILSEIKSLMASVRNQLEELDAKIAQWQQMVEPDEVIDVTSVIGEMDFFDRVYEYGDEPVVKESHLEQEPEQSSGTVEEPVDELVEDPVEEVVEGIVEEPVDEHVEDPVEMPIEADDVPEEADDDLPFFDVPEAPSVEEELLADESVVESVEEQVAEEPAVEPAAEEELPAVEEQAAEDTVFEQTVFEEKPMPEPAPVVLNDVHASAEKTAVIDAMTQKHRWRTAMPGAPVKDIRGAIALMDRVLFINTLFGTDPMAFQDALTRINQMQTLDEAVGYLASAHPEWDFDSDVVYSFMMAVRRKVNS
jgi:hypothetical protein